MLLLLKQPPPHPVVRFQGSACRDQEAWVVLAAPVEQPRGPQELPAPQALQAGKPQQVPGAPDRDQAAVLRLGRQRNGF